MRVGEKRTLVLGPDYGYGETGAGHQDTAGGETPTLVIPGGSTLRFTTMLIGINMPEGAANEPCAERETLMMYGQHGCVHTVHRSCSLVATFLAVQRNLCCKCCKCAVLLITPTTAVLHLMNRHA